MIRGSYIQGVNLTDYVDQKYLPGKKYDGTYDPEGFLSTLPAIVTCLLGIFAGLLLRNTEVSARREEVVYLVSFGAGGVLLGFLWGTQFPVIKKIWISRLTCSWRADIARHFVGGRFLDCGYDEISGLVPAVRLDGHELHHDLIMHEQYLKAFRKLGQPAGRRRGCSEFLTSM